VLEWAADEEDTLTMQRKRTAEQYSLTEGGSKKRKGHTKKEMSKSIEQTREIIDNDGDE
jgi:hypothetical protein